MSDSNSSNNDVRDIALKGAQELIAKLVERLEAISTTAKFLSIEFDQIEAAQAESALKGMLAAASIGPQVKSRPSVSGIFGSPKQPPYKPESSTANTFKK